MRKGRFQHAATAAATIMISLSLVMGGAFAKNNNGNGGGQGKSESGHASSSKASKRGGAQTKAKNQNRARSLYEYELRHANAFGKLNGFLHASPTALAKASPKSAIGKVSKVYAGLLQAYLAPEDGSVPPTAGDLVNALSDASNKPLTAEVIAAVNDKLLASNPDLSASLESSGKTADDLNSEIAAGL